MRELECAVCEIPLQQYEIDNPFLDRWDREVCDTCGESFPPELTEGQKILFDLSRLETVTNKCLSLIEKALITVQLVKNHVTG